MGSLADRRRNLGPTDAHAFLSGKTNIKEYIGDGPRPVFVSQGVAAHATGSAYLETGSIKLQCTVNGPSQLRTGDRFNDQAEISVNVNVGPLTGLCGSDADTLQRTLADFVRGSVSPVILRKQYPKSCITIYLEVLGLGSRAPQLAAAVNVATMALVNSGIALADMVVAVAVGMEEERVLADADPGPEHPQAVVAYANGTGNSEVVSLLVLGESAVERLTLEKLLQQAEDAAVQLRRVFNGYLVEDYAEKVKANLE